MLFQPKLNSALGALYGAAIGDALGATTEFSRPDVKAKWPAIATGQMDIVGGGAFGVSRGQITDDTQMAIAMIRGFRARKVPTVTAVLNEYRNWVKVCFDAGGQTRSALAWTGIVDKDDVRTYPGAALFLKNHKFGGGNGSLMRSAPIAVKFHNDISALIEYAVKDALLTHADPRCPLAGAAYNAAIAYALNGGKADRAVVIAEEALQIATDYLASLNVFPLEEVERAADDIQEDLTRSQDADPGLLKSGNGPHLYQTSGYVRVAFRYAFWCLRHATKCPTMTQGFEDSVLDATNRGGDSDTNAAIIGGLVGAYTGFSALPPAWRTTIRQALQDPAKKKANWSDIYHPKHFLDFVYDSILPAE